NLNFWKEELATSLVPQNFNVTKSSSVAVGGMVVYNEVRGGAEAFIEDAAVQAAEVAVAATSSATISAIADNASESSGGSSFDGSGTSAAVNATVATNNVLGGAVASIVRSAVAATGDVTVEARNASVIGAEVQSAVTSA